MNFGAEIPFVTHLGFDLIRFEDGESTLIFLPRPEHQNSFGVAHGGVIMTLLDVTMVSAARSVAPEMGLITIEMKTTFMKAAPGDGSVLTCLGHLIQRTASMAFVEAKLYDNQEQLCAHSTGTFKYAKRPDSKTVLAGLPANQISTD